MNQDTVKKLLLTLNGTNVDFTITFTGKKSKLANGLYKPDTHEILLHNKNFNTDNQLIYTAIHEYVHHLCWENEERNNLKHPIRCHHTAFWALMHGLLDIAVEKQIYQRNQSAELNKLIKEAHELDVEIANLQKKLGKLLSLIHEQCEEENIRYEDIVDHDLQMDRKTANTSVKLTSITQDTLGQDAQKLVISAAKDMEAVQTQINSGKTIRQIKQTLMNHGKSDNSESEILEKEKNRLEKTIYQLQSRLEIIIDKMQRINENAA